jgi:hypothetical protein
MGNHIGRKGVEILIDKVKEMLDKGMSIYEVWKNTQGRRSTTVQGQAG